MNARESAKSTEFSEFASKTNKQSTRQNSQDRSQCDIAIVGMSGIYSSANNLVDFWKAIVRGTDCTRLVRENEWLRDDYYNRNSTSFEQAYCGRGGFIDGIEFDPVKYGVMPNSVNGADVDQFAALRVACEALIDAGIDRTHFNGERAEVLVGRVGAPGNGVMNMIQCGTTIIEFIDILKHLHPEHTEEELKVLATALRNSLQPCSADTIPGVMPNILAGRIAGRLGFRGRSMVIDSACASSLIAIETGVRDLQSGMCDLVLAGGVHINSLAVFYQMFCGLGALSRREIISPFDDEADGTLLGDGVGMVVLKRLGDAIENGDRIYAVIKGVGSSSDGLGTSMLAPSWAGEALAMERAYEMAQVSPHTVGLLEAHGTATPTGDVTEMTAVQKVFKADETHRQWCALGSVKSNFGHTQAAAGVAGIMKTALALYQKILPPTLNVSNPNKQIDWQNSPCYVNSRARIWIHPQVHAKVDLKKYPGLNFDTPPRRAAVSAFGFGGVNAHVVLEEHCDAIESDRNSPFPEWESEVCLFAGETIEGLLAQLTETREFAQGVNALSLKDVAYTLFLRYQKAGKEKKKENENGSEKEKEKETRQFKVSIVASSLLDLSSKLEKVLTAMAHASDSETFAKGAKSAMHPDIYFTGNVDARSGRVAFVLPGLGAAYPNMLSDLSAHFPDVRAVFDFVDQLALANGATELPSEKIFPNPYKIESSKSSVALLANEDSAVVMLLMAEWALYTVLQELGIKPDVLVGVSTGEFAVLNISGACDVLETAPSFYKFSTTVAREVPQDSLADLRSLKIDIDGKQVEELLKDIEPKVYLAAALSPTQSLVSGDKAAIAEAQNILRAKNITSNLLPTAIPYHTPLVAGHIKPDNEELAKLPLNAPLIESWSCSMAAQYPTDSKALREISTNLFTRPIRLQETIEKIYETGVTKFIEVGPKGVLTSVISETLEGKPHLAVASNRAVGSAIGQLNHLVAALACHDVPLDLNYLFKRRNPKDLDFSAPIKAPSKSNMFLRMIYPSLSVDDQTAGRLRDSFVTARRESYNADAAQNVAPFVAANAASVVTGNPMAGSLANPAANAEINAAINPAAHTPLNPAINPAAKATEYSSVSFAAHSTTPPAFQPGSAHDQSHRGEQVLAYQSFLPNGLPSNCELLSAGLFALQVEQNSVTAQLNLNIFDHQYLVDHAIGGMVSTAYGAERVFLLPLTVALELMTEAASLLSPQMVAVKLKSIRALRRIKVGLNGTRVTVTSKASSSQANTYEASIFIHQEDDGIIPGVADSAAAMSCEIEFSSNYPATKKVDTATLVTSSQAPALRPEQLYGMDTMFHGPRMQSVLNLTRLNRKQILGQVAARPASGWLTEQQNPQFVSNPLLLDNATQLVLFHLYEHDLPANALLPFLVESLEIFADLSSLRGEITVFAELSSITNRGTEADVTLIASDGSVLAKFNTICSRGIALEEPWKTFIYDPLNCHPAGINTEEVLSLVPDSPLWAVASFGNTDLPSDEVTLTWLMDYIFNQTEQRYCELAFKTGPRRREWLMGRLAAKQAVRALLLKLHGVNVALADIVIMQNDVGKPFASGEFVNQLGWMPLVSLSHKDGQVIAVAAHPQMGDSIGIDLENCAEREEGFERLAFTELEQDSLARVSQEAKKIMMAALWSCKEAAAKASGMGLRNNPKSIQIHSAVTDQSPDFSQFWQAEITSDQFKIILPVLIKASEKNVVAISSLAAQTQAEPVLSY
jgi:acyl transferase domain-containing protein/phosphopantetheinyl transferase